MEDLSYQVVLRISADLREALEAAATRERRSISSLIRNALADQFCTVANGAPEPARFPCRLPKKAEIHPVVSAAPQPKATRIVRTIAERAAQLGIADKTLRNEIDRGRGPIVTRLSVGRIGIRDDHWDQWLESRKQ